MYLSQSAFSRDTLYDSLSSGLYEIAYTDNTHLEPGDLRNLVTIDIREHIQKSESRESSFGLKLSLDAKFNSPGKEKYRDRVEDVISLSALRLGLMAPRITGKSSEQLLELKRSKGIVLIPDTNSLYNGTLHWLLNVLRDRSLWILPFVMSLTQMQSRDAGLKAMLRDPPKYSNLPQALRSRALVNAGLGLLERNNHRYQVLEMDPSLLRYMRTAAKSGFDPDESEVLEDRLLIEGVHSILRSTRTRATQIVVTSDVLLARVLSAEGIPNICLPTSRLGTTEINSFRYDAWAGTYVGTTIRALLWDLAHTFGFVRLTGANVQPFTLSCYWPGKTPQDWVDECLEVRSYERPAQSPSQAAPASPAAVRPERKVAPSRSPATKTTPAPVEASLQQPADGPSDRQVTFSDAAVPQASLPLTLKVAGVVYEKGKIQPESLLDSMPGDNRPTRGNVLRALEVLRRAKLIDFDGDSAASRAELVEFDSNLRSSNLDELSRQFEYFAPYRIIIQQLKSDSELLRENVHELLERSLGESVAQEASLRLVRYHILFGQCWTDDRKWRDGSQRPSEQQFVEAFGRVFDRVAKDNIARMSDFLPELCREERMSPWAAERAAQQYARRLSADYSFQYAAGGKPTGVDQIISGSLVAPTELVVPLDRIEIGGRPILTLGRVK